MLGCKQQRQPKLFYSLVNLDKRVRADNPLRKIHDIIDFSFVRPQVEHFYGKRGNPSIDPIVLMKLMVILFLENIPSERELMRRLPERLDWLWFCQYDLDNELPDHSVLSKARRRWGLRGPLQSSPGSRRSRSGKTRTRRRPSLRLVSFCTRPTLGIRGSQVLGCSALGTGVQKTGFEASRTGTTWISRWSLCSRRVRARSCKL